MNDTPSTAAQPPSSPVALGDAPRDDARIAAELAPSVDLSYEPARARVLLSIAVVAVAGDVAMRSGVDTYGGAIGGVVAIGAVLSAGRVRSREARVLFIAAGVFVACTAFRQSSWLLPFDAAASVVLVALGALLARSGSLFDMPMRSLGERALLGFAHSVTAPEFAVGPIRGRRAGVALRGALVAFPLVVILVALLGSADRVFAALLGLDSLDAGDVVAHGALLTLAGWSAAAVLRTASARADVRRRGGARFFGATEAMIVLAAIALVLAVFSVAQILDLVDANRRILARRGLAHADYARTGFFQLVFVAGIVVTIVLALRAITRATTDRQARRFTTLGVGTCALTLPVVVVSVRRLALYEDEYGLTMLRLYSTAAAISIGVIVVLVGLAIAGLGRDRVWLPGAILIVGLGALFAMNVINPEALVARTNLNRSDPIVRPNDAFREDASIGVGVGDLDVAYLGDLSTDAVPTVVAHLDRLDPADRDELLNRLCRRNFDSTNWLGSNRSVRRAEAALASVC